MKVTNYSLPEFTKEVVKEIMETIMKAERAVFIEEHGGTKNGFYRRALDTLFGKIEDIKVPRDREGRFQTQLIEPYKRRDITLDELIFGMFVSMSTRSITRVLETIFDLKYSPATISRIGEITSEEISKWKNRRLKNRYSVIMLDGMYLSVRRETVSKEVVLFVLGIDEKGRKEILDFEVNPSEGAQIWAEMIERLYSRGVREVLIFVSDGINGLEEKIKKYFPEADFQLCVVHKLRNILSKVRVKDRKEVAQNLKRIYQSKNKEEALRHFEQFQKKWRYRYPRVIISLERDLEKLLIFLEYPESIQRVIYTTNLIERVQKEIRRRIKVIGALPSVDSVEKFMYLRVAMLNEKYSERIIRGFLQASEDIHILFSSRFLMAYTNFLTQPNLLLRN